MPDGVGGDAAPFRIDRHADDDGSREQGGIVLRPNPHFDTDFVVAAEIGLLEIDTIDHEHGLAAEPAHLEPGAARPEHRLCFLSVRKVKRPALLGRLEPQRQHDRPAVHDACVAGSGRPHALMSLLDGGFGEGERGDKHHLGCEIAAKTQGMQHQVLGAFAAEPGVRCDFHRALDVARADIDVTLPTVSEHGVVGLAERAGASGEQTGHEFRGEQHRGSPPGVPLSRRG